MGDYTNTKMYYVHTIVCNTDKKKIFHDFYCSCYTEVIWGSSTHSQHEMKICFVNVLDLIVNDSCM